MVSAQPRDAASELLDAEPRRPRMIFMKVSAEKAAVQAGWHVSAVY